MEILTNILSDAQFRQELAETVQFLSRRGVRETAVAFAFTMECPDLDDVLIRHVIATGDVPTVVADRERTKGFQLGEYDCWIEPVGLGLRFLFCNDRDIHAISESAKLLDAVRSHWRAMGYNVYPDDLKNE